MDSFHLQSSSIITIYTLPPQQPPFLLDTGQVPCMGFGPSQRRSHVKSVNEFKEHMQDALEEAKAALAKSKDDMAKYYDWK